MFYAVLYLSKKTGIIHTTSTATAAGVPDTFHQIPALKPWNLSTIEIFFKKWYNSNSGKSKWSDTTVSEST